MSASKPCVFMLNSFSVSLIAPTSPHKYSLNISKMPSTVLQVEVLVVPGGTKQGCLSTGTQEMEAVIGTTDIRRERPPRQHSLRRHPRSRVH